MKRSADRAGLGLRVGVVVFDSFDEQMTTYALEDVPGFEFFFRLENVLRIAGDQRGGLGSCTQIAARTDHPMTERLLGADEVAELLSVPVSWMTSGLRLRPKCRSRNLRIGLIPPQPCSGCSRTQRRQVARRS